MEVSNVLFPTWDKTISVVADFYSGRDIFLIYFEIFGTAKFLYKKDNFTVVLLYYGDNHSNTFAKLGG